MDSDRVDGAATNMGGKLKDAVGGLIGDTGLQAEGKSDQVGGRVQNAYGSAKDAVGDGAATLADQIEDFVHDQPVVAMLSAATIGFLIARLIR
ncbi:MAG: CsbD family protein [Janthinobacterium lividum]